MSGEQEARLRRNKIRSKDGNFRYQMEPTDDIAVLLSKILEASPNADPTTMTISDQPRGNEVPIVSLKGRNLKSIGVNHGDLLFVGYKDKVESTVISEPSSSTAPQAPASDEKRAWELVTEDAVDSYWRTKDGKIPRGRDIIFCKHGLKGMCDYCMPLEPYDAAFHKENSIKHLSYHAYLKKLAPKTTTSSASFLPPLDPLSYRVKTPCPTGGHPAWPAGICTSCQPSAITLQSQPFRMVDHLEIASMDIVDRFLQSWRMTGLQRFGWMIGRYEPYDKVPMGIKAVVEAIYEPPQEGELDGLTLGLPWEDEQRIRRIAEAATTPLTVVGYIFTDLDPTEEDRTKNVFKRHPGSFYISSLEAIFAAVMQTTNPTPSKSSPTGKFSSRLVTAILTGTEDGQVDVSAYQVSAQAEAMVEADMIEASVDPGIVRVKEEDRSQDTARYVPDVFFSFKNEYGLEVKKSAKPAFPVEYLLVNVTHGFPQNPSPMFRSTAFKIENRQGLEDQTVDSVLSSLLSLNAPDIVESKKMIPGQAHKTFELAKWLSDLHLIAFLDTTQLLSPTLMTFARESAPRNTHSSSAMDEDIPQDVLDQIAAEQAASGGSGAARICPHCTYENYHGGHDCEVCGLPLQ
ncbi:NPL4 family-domain-containing protein [Mucidula mucida]|nr:NPL4 family-domain-containing protein [Mucidula mucida]